MNAQSSIGFAALFVTWIAIVFLALIATSLHVRLQRLERSETSQSQTPAFRELLGRALGEVAPEASSTVGPRIVLFVSEKCASCERVLSELGRMKAKFPVAVAWTGKVPDDFTLPEQAVTMPEGAELAERLGIKVTPFAVVTGEEGRIVEATPVNSLASLHRMFAASAAPT